MITNKFDVYFEKQSQNMLFSWPDKYLLKAFAIAASDLDNNKITTFELNSGDIIKRYGLMGLTLGSWNNANLMNGGKFPKFGSERKDILWNVLVGAHYIAWARRLIAKELESGIADPNEVPTWLLAAMYWMGPERIEDIRKFLNKDMGGVILNYEVAKEYLDKDVKSFCDGVESIDRVLRKGLK